MNTKHQPMNFMLSALVAVATACAAPRHGEGEPKSPQLKGAKVKLETKKECGIKDKIDKIWSKKGSGDTALWAIHNTCAMDQKVEIRFDKGNPLASGCTLEVTVLAGRKEDISCPIDKSADVGKYPYTVWIGGAPAVDPEIEIYN